VRKALLLSDPLLCFSKFHIKVETVGSACRSAAILVALGKRYQMADGPQTAADHTASAAGRQRRGSGAAAGRQRRGSGAAAARQRHGSGAATALALAIRKNGRRGMANR
jgi:hypothetical protein